MHVVTSRPADSSQEDSYILPVERNGVSAQHGANCGEVSHPRGMAAPPPAQTTERQAAGTVAAEAAAAEAAGRRPQQASDLAIPPVGRSTDGLEQRSTSVMDDPLYPLVRSG